MNNTELFENEMLVSEMSFEEKSQTLLYECTVNASDDPIRNVERVSLLLQAGADVNIKDDWGTPLHHICTPHEGEDEGSIPLEIAQLLLNYGADVNEVNNELNQTPLHNLCWFSKEKGIFELFLEKGANIEARDRDRCTPLHLACLGGNVEMIDLLLQHGANIEATDKDGNTPLHTILLNFDLSIDETIETIQSLMNHRPDLNFNARNNRPSAGKRKIAFLLSQKLRIKG